jgi:uridylate kinase
MKRVIVLSLGGSLIVPDNINLKFLNEFKKIILKNSDKYKFVIVCGGGSVARKYIHALRDSDISDKIQSLAGISVTRLNARFMTWFFGSDVHQGIPHTMKQVKNLLKRNNIVFCGALRYRDNETSDSNAAKLSVYFKTDFINITNVKGLYTKNPKEHKDAVFIPQISKKDLGEMVNKIHFKPGQHFVIDQKAMHILKKSKNKLYILGNDILQLDNLLNERDFVGTVVG